MIMNFWYQYGFSFRSVLNYLDSFCFFTKFYFSAFQMHVIITGYQMIYSGIEVIYAITYVAIALLC